MLLSAAEARAQYDPSYHHYFDMEPMYNPASVGKQAMLNVSAAYALDFAGYDNNPRTMSLSADMPFYFLKAYHGAGIQLLNDQIGLFRHQRLALEYAFRFKLAGGQLAIGVQGGFISESFDGSKLDIEDDNDPALSKSKVDGSGMDVAAGLYYTHKQWYAGLSVQHATSPTIDLGETQQLEIKPSYYFTGGYNIQFRNPFLQLKPSVLVRYDGTTWREDITARLQYTTQKRRMYIGAGYSPSNSVTIYLGGIFHGVMVGYCYEMYTGAISPGNGSHELHIGYQTDINLMKRGKNRHQSVRIL